MSKLEKVGIVVTIVASIYVAMAIAIGWIASGNASMACSYIHYDNYGKVTENFHPERHYEPNMWTLGTTGVCKS